MSRAHVFENGGCGWGRRYLPLEAVLRQTQRVRGQGLSLCSLLILQHRVAPSIDLVLLSHGDLAHTGLYPYAHSRWGLKAPAYSTLPVQAMARIAATEEAEGIRDEEDVGSADEQENPVVSANSEPPEDSPNVPQENQAEPSPYPQPHSSKDKYVATPQEVHDSFNAVNTLRYSQPAHLSGN